MKWPRPVAIVLAAAAIGLAAPASGADDPGVVPFDLQVGEARKISAGPVRELICDQGGLVEPAFTDSGVVLKGLRAGTTLCSFRDVASIRTVLRVTVLAAAPAPSPPPKGSPSSGYGS
jgi:hypothetical protein